MTEIQKKKLLKAQQGELDAVLLYKKLAGAVKKNQEREAFLQVAADEGKHASILREYTGEVLQPKSGKANLVYVIYKVFGKRVTFRMLANGELKSIDGYLTLVKDFPRIKEIAEDEAKHAKIASDLLQA